MPHGFHLLIATQFVSALADNALLIVAIALLDQTGQPAWWAPLLKACFTIAYVVLAPLAGPLADGMAKARLMVWMNACKLVGMLALCAGLHPLLAFAIVGLGAAGYAPAKYGLITEMVGPAQLVRANAWIEVSVVGAVLLGTALGGLLVSDGVLHTAPSLVIQAWFQAHGLAAGTTLGPAFTVLLILYLLAAALNTRIPDSGARYAPQSVHPLAMGREFWRCNRLLWQDRLGGRLSLSVTTLFWGVGAVLQFAVLRQASDVLALPLSQAAYLQAVVAVGVVVGATLAGRCISLAAAPRVLPMGIVLGLLALAGAFAEQVPTAAVVMALVGCAGGWLVVPMNALLQHRGHRLLSAGRSVAVQGFNENSSVLVMLVVYAGLLRAQVSIVDLMAGLGATLAAVMLLIWWRHRRSAASP